MFEINPEPGKSLLVAKLFGVVRACDFLEGMPIFEKLVAETHPRGLLCDWTELKGWDEEAESIRFFVPARSSGVCNLLKDLALSWNSVNSLGTV